MVSVAKELEVEHYHDIKRITARKDNVIRLWEYLLELLKARRQRLEMNLGLQRVFQEMLYIMDWMDEMKVRVYLKDHHVIFGLEQEVDHCHPHCWSSLFLVSRCCCCLRTMGSIC